MEFIDDFANNQLASQTVNKDLFDIAKEKAQEMKSSLNDSSTTKLVSDEEIRKYVDVGISFLDYGIDKVISTFTGNVPQKTDEVDRAKEGLVDCISEKLIEMNFVKIPFWLVLLFFLGTYIFAKISAANGRGTRMDIEVLDNEEETTGLS